MNDIQPITLPGIDPRRPLVIAGPCSAETEEQVLDTARSLAAEGIRICRAGLWKPRTKPGGFEGVGEAGIAWLQRVKRETGMYTSTEVATREHVATRCNCRTDAEFVREYLRRARHDLVIG